MHSVSGLGSGYPSVHAGWDAQFDSRTRPSFRNTLFACVVTARFRMRKIAAISLLPRDSLCSVADWAGLRLERPRDLEIERVAEYAGLRLSPDQIWVVRRNCEDRAVDLHAWRVWDPGMMNSDDQWFCLCFIRHAEHDFVWFVHALSYVIAMHRCKTLDIYSRITRVERSLWDCRSPQSYCIRCIPDCKKHLNW